MTTLCAHADSDTPSRYVAGVLPVDEAAEFEEHYFSCSRCWDEVQTGSAARALLMKARPEPATRRQPGWWMGVAAAAVVVVIALVAIRDRVVRDEADVLRGDSGSTISVVAERTATQVRIRWRAVASASRYEIAVRSAEGEVLQQKSSAETSMLFDGVPEHEVFIRVTAFDAQGGEIVRSPLVRVPSR